MIFAFDANLAVENDKKESGTDTMVSVDGHNGKGKRIECRRKEKWKFPFLRIDWNCSGGVLIIAFFVPSHRLWFLDRDSTDDSTGYNCLNRRPRS